MLAWYRLHNESDLLDFKWKTNNSTAKKKDRETSALCIRWKSRDSWRATRSISPSFNEIDLYFWQHNFRIISICSWFASAGRWKFLHFSGREFNNIKSLGEGRGASCMQNVAHLDSIIWRSLPQFALKRGKLIIITQKIDLNTWARGRKKKISCFEALLTQFALNRGKLTKFLAQ